MSRLATAATTCLGTLAVAVAVAALGWNAATQRSREARRDQMRIEDTAAEAAANRDPARPLVVWIGDSTMMGDPSVSYPRIVESRLAEGVPATHVLLAAPGLDFFTYYCLVSRAVAWRPSVIVLPANPVLMLPSPSGRTLGDLCGDLALADVARALRLPLRAGNLSMATLIGERLQRDLGLRGLVAFGDGLRRLLQERLPWKLADADARQRNWANVLRGPSGTLHDAIEVFVDGWKRNLRAHVPRDAPIMRMLGATVREATRAGVPILVIGNPVPGSKTVADGRYHPAEFRRRFPIGAVVEAAGGVFVDLHDALPEAVLRDGWVHYTPAGAARIASRIEPLLQPYLARFDPRTGASL